MSEASQHSIWPTLVGATAVVLAGHWLLMLGWLIGEGGAGSALTPVLAGIGLAVMAGAAFGAVVASGNTASAGLAAVLVGGTLTLILWALLPNEVPLPAINAGIGVAAALGIRRTARHSLWVRLLMTAAIFGYVLWVTEFSAAFAVIVAPLLPFLTVGISDYASERETQRRSATGYAGRK